MTCDADEVFRGGSERLWVSGSLGASEEEDTSTARLTQSPRSHSPAGFRTLSGVLRLQQQQVRYLRVKVALGMTALH